MLWQKNQNLIIAIKEGLLPFGGLRKDFAEEISNEIDLEGWVNLSVGRLGEYFGQRGW